MNLIIPLIIIGVVSFFGIFYIISYAENVLFDVLMQVVNIITNCEDAKNGWGDVCGQYESSVIIGVIIIKFALSIMPSIFVIRLIKRKM